MFVTSLTLFAESCESGAKSGEENVEVPPLADPNTAETAIVPLPMCPADAPAEDVSSSVPVPECAMDDPVAVVAAAEPVPEVPADAIIADEASAPVPEAAAAEPEDWDAKAASEPLP